MNIKDIVIDSEKTLGEVSMIGEPTPIHEYVNGKKTEVVIGMKIPILLEKGWNKDFVKCEDKEISIEYSGNKIPIELIEPKIKMWQDFETKEIKSSITAKSIRVSQNNKLKIGRGDI